MIKVLMVGIVLFGFAGCSSYSSNFDCKPQKGFGCKSTSYVNEAIGSGYTPEKEAEPKKDSYFVEKKGKKKGIELTKETKKIVVRDADYSRTADQKVYRKKEEVLKIWIASNETKDGGYEKSQTTFEVLTPGSWLEAE
jgi:type IV conjugative transfer system lipoprotein TraV